MKKIVLLMLILASLFVMAACQDTPDSSTAEGTTSTVPASTTAAVTTKPDGKLEETENYTAVLNEAKWQNGTGVDTDAFDYFGSAGDVSNRISAKYSGTRTWQIEKDGKIEPIKYTDVKKLGLVGAKVEEKENKGVLVTLTEIEMKVQSSWKSVTAKAGSYLMFEFKSSLPVEFCTTVTTKAGGSVSESLYTQGDISVKKASDGSYVGIAKCTVPFTVGQTYYINVCINNGREVLTSVPVSVTKPKYDTGFQLIIRGEWQDIKDPDYLDTLIELFYTVYPRLYARWGVISHAPKTITLETKHDGGVASNSGDYVYVCTDWANEAPDDVGFLIHELTHATQQFKRMAYGAKYPDGSESWFTEAMADYGRFRYFHWGFDPDYVKYHNYEDIVNFKWEHYSGHNMFMVWMDYNWPTTIDDNGNKKYGVIDYIAYQTYLVSDYDISDQPTKAGTPFNNWIKEITGYESAEALRLKFLEEFTSGKFTFTGFADHGDNWLTENVPGVPNPTYPKEEKYTPSAPTGDKLSTPITSGTNLAASGTIVSSAGAASSGFEADKILDGDTATRLQAKKSDGLKKLNGIDNEIVIDLGAVKTFDTYTLYNDSAKAFITKAWEILVSTDGVTYTAVDYQSNNADSIVSVSFEEQSARYIKIRLYNAGNAGATRIYEFMLFQKD